MFFIVILLFLNILACNPLEGEKTRKTNNDDDDDVYLILNPVMFSENKRNMEI